MSPYSDTRPQLFGHSMNFKKCEGVLVLKIYKEQSQKYILCKIPICQKNSNPKCGFTYNNSLYFIALQSHISHSNPHKAHINTINQVIVQAVSHKPHISVIK